MPILAAFNTFDSMGLENMHKISGAMSDGFAAISDARSYRIEQERKKESPK